MRSFITLFLLASLLSAPSTFAQDSASNPIGESHETYTRDLKRVCDSVGEYKRDHCYQHQEALAKICFEVVSGRRNCSGLSQFQPSLPSPPLLVYARNFAQEMIAQDREASKAKLRQ